MRLFKQSLFFLALAVSPLAATTGPSSGGGASAEALVAPEPATWLLMATGIGGVLVRAALKSRKKQ
jgi:hypothetical protein